MPVVQLQQAALDTMTLRECLEQLPALANDGGGSSGGGGGGGGDGGDGGGSPLAQLQGDVSIMFFSGVP